MTDTDVTPQLPPDSPTASWLARNRKFAILIGIVLGLGGVAALTAFPRSPQATTTESIVVVESSTALTNQSTRETFERFPARVIQDTDGDGLSDSVEQDLGTNPNQFDTDNDGLTDREEIEVYRSDPVRPDTDGDGHTDGLEVETGNNPNGPGLLRDLEAAIQQIQ